MRKKKILVFTDCYIFGGSERLMTFLLKNEILSQNFNLLFGYRKFKEYEKGLKNEGLLGRENNFPLILLSNRSLFHKINCISTYSFFKWLLKIPFFCLDFFKIYNLWNLYLFIRLLNRTKPDLIHINNGGYPGADTCNLLVLANYLSIKSKVIYQVNNQAFKRKNFLEIYVDKFINDHVNFFINASELAKEQLISKRNFDSEKILLVNNCVPLPDIKLSRAEVFQELNIPLDSFLIVQVAFLTERKGQKYLIDSIAELFNKGEFDLRSVFCAFVGSGEDKELLSRYIIKLGLSSNIFLLDYRENSEDYISACDLFVLPSVKDEDMPLVLLSALGYGKAIIATDFAGISQAIKSDINGILINKDKNLLTNNLVKSILKLYKSHTLRNILGENAQKSYLEYSPDMYGKSLKKIYERSLIY